MIETLFITIKSIDFIDLNYLYLIPLFIILWFFTKTSNNYISYFSNLTIGKVILNYKSNNNRFLFLICSILVIISFARPVIKNEPIKSKSEKINLVCAFDLSKSMLANDVFPNRIDFAKNKFVELIKELKEERVGILGFTSRSFLISPITEDYSTLRYFIKHMNPRMVSVQGSNLISVLKSTNNLLKSQKKKVLIVFTDGTDSTDFTKSIEYANNNNIKVFVYAIASDKGSVITLEDGSILKDANKNIVITSLNKKIKSIALNTGGGYLKYSNTNDMPLFIKNIRKQLTKQKGESQIINTDKELFYYPLLLAFLFFLLSKININLDLRMLTFKKNKYIKKELNNEKIRND
jgi:Ca-activated chloride channel family protein